MSKLTGYAVLAIFGYLCWTSAAQADSYDEAFARSRQLEARGDLPAAARELEGILAEYPQDYALVIELGWLRFRAGQYRESERSYREAIRRSPAALDAQLGLGWTLVRQGRCLDALPALQLYLDAYPAGPRAQEALGVCSHAPAPAASAATDSPPPAAPLPPAGSPDAGLPTTLAVSVAGGLLRLPSHPIKSGGQGITVGVDAAFQGKWLLGGAFRTTSISTVEGSGVDPFSQREIYAYAGVATARAGLLFHVASVHDGSGTFGTSTHGGASLRLSGSAGDALLSAYASSYPDKLIFRIEPAWRIPLGDHISMIPGAAIQRTDAETLTTATFTLVLDGAAGRLWIGGKYGTEERPAYLLQSVVDNISERIRGGLWVGGRLPLSPHFALTAQYAFDRLEQTGALTPASSVMHSYSLGLVANF